MHIKHPENYTETGATMTLWVLERCKILISKCMEVEKKNNNKQTNKTPQFTKNQDIQASSNPSTLIGSVQRTRVVRLKRCICYCQQSTGNKIIPSKVGEAQALSSRWIGAGDVQLLVEEDTVVGSVADIYKQPVTRRWG